MDNTTRWNTYTEALARFTEREGHARVPTSHVEVLDSGQQINLGSWVGYVRQRKRAGLLSPDRINDLDLIPGWQWGPLRPGPVTDESRNNQIAQMRATGLSLQKIGDEFGLSRQRVHQIVRGAV